MSFVFYTGPFGTEPQSFLTSMSESERWLQRDASGQVVGYDEQSGLLMFDPQSPYFLWHRRPRMEVFIEKTGCDGVFFDIPLMMRKTVPRIDLSAAALLTPRE